jgi:hypothetical protein
MKFNADAIVKALKCCNVPSDRACSECPYHEVGAECRTKRNKDAAELIVKFAQESQKWQEAYDCADSACRELSSKCDELTEKKEEYCRECAELRVVLYEITDEVNQIKADVVRKIQKLFEERLDISVCGYSTEEVVGDVLETLDRVAKEVLED